MYSLHFIDISIIFSYLMACLFIGTWRIKKISNIKEYAIGKKCISTPLLVGTLFATHIGAGSTVGTIEKVYSMGAIFALVILLEPFIWITTCLVYSRRIAYFRAVGCISLSDIMYHLYGAPGRWVTNITSKTVGIAIIAMQILAIGYLLSYYLNVSQIQGAIIGFGVLMLYSAFGGIRAIIATDLFQALTLYIGIPAACFAAYYDVGGYNSIVSKLPAEYLGFDLTSSNIRLFLSMAVWMLIPFSHGAFVQRFLMAENNKQVWQVGKIIFFLNLPISLVVITIAYIVKVKAPDINPNLAFYYLIDNYLPIGVKGLVIAGILAAIMSTADSWLNTASIVWAHDIIKKLRPSITNFQEVLIARIAVVIIGILAAILIFVKPDSIMALDWLACSLWEPIIFVPLMSGLLGYKFSSQSFIIAVIIGIIFAIVGAYLTAKGTSEFLIFDTLSLCTGIIGSSIGLISTQLFKKYLKNNKKINNLQKEHIIKRLIIYKKNT